MGTARRKRCLWCLEPDGCLECTKDGNDPKSYRLIPESMVDVMLAKQRRKLLITISILSGSLLGAAVLVLILTFYLFL